MLSELHEVIAHAHLTASLGSEAHLAIAPPLMRDSEIKDQVARSSIVMQKFPYLNISALPPPCLL